MMEDEAPSTAVAVPRADLDVTPAPRLVNPWRVVWMLTRLGGSFAWWWGPAVACFTALATFTSGSEKDQLAATFAAIAANGVWLLLNITAAKQKIGTGPWEELLGTLKGAWAFIERKAREP